MKDRRSGCLGLSIGLAIALFLILTINILHDYTFYFTSLERAAVDNGILYGMDTDGEDTTLFRASLETGTGSILRVPLEDRGRIVTTVGPYISLGESYFRQYYYDKNGNTTETMVWWDTKRNRLVKVSPQQRTEVFKNSRGPDNGWVIEESKPGEGSALEKMGKVELLAKYGDETYRVDHVSAEMSRLLLKFAKAAGLSILLFIAVFTIMNLAAYYNIHPGLWFRLSGAILLMMLVLLPLIGKYMTRYLYAYACRHALYHCAEEASIRAQAVNDSRLREFITGEERFSPDRMDEVWRLSPDDIYVEPDPYGDGTKHDRNYDLDRNHQRAWNLYDDGVVTEENCIIVKTPVGVRALFNDRVQPNGWLRLRVLEMGRNIQRSFENNSVSSFLYVTKRQRYACAMVPKTLESGDVVLVCVRISLNPVLMLFTSVRERTLNVFLRLAEVMLVLMLIQTYLALRPLKSLKEAVRGITAGDLKARAKAQGCNEFHHLALVFNAMAEQLERQSEGTDSYRDFYEAFIPASLLRRLSGRSVPGAIHPGAVYRKTACALVVGAGTSAVPGGPDPDVYSEALRSAREHGGHAAGFDGRHVRLVYTEEPDEALRSAADLEQSLLSAGKPYAWAGMSYCPAELCVVGSDERKNVIEQDGNEAEVLSGIAEKLKIPVILTEALFLHTEHDAGKLHFRCLGRIGMGGYTPDEPLYELLDASPAEEKAAREYSRTIFEHGVSAYAEGDYFTARNEMIRVLELEPGDLAARCYVLNCDRKEPPTVCQVREQAV